MSIDQSQLDRCVALAREFGVRKLILFGSAAENPAAARDLDVASEGIEGWDIFRFGARLEEELGIQVDLVALSPGDRFSRYIAARGRVLYERK